MRDGVVDAQQGLAGAAQAIAGAPGQHRLPRPIRDFAASVAEWASVASVVGELLDPPESEPDSDDSSAA